MKKLNDLVLKYAPTIIGAIVFGVSGFGLMLIYLLTNEYCR